MSDIELDGVPRPGVRNHRVVREVDRAGTREMWQWAFVLLGLVAVLVGSVSLHFLVLNHRYAIERLVKAKAAEDELTRHLLLERATLLAPQRLERIATRQLGLVPPAAQKTIVVERVTPAAPPGRGVVASR
jgi:cell division protein FtsL